MVVYYASSEHTSSELYHHGIKGMHWHERRFQNKDGSLTAAGRVRYGVGQAGRGLAKVVKGAGSLATKAGTAAGQGIKKAVIKAKEESRAKKVKKLTATKSDLAKNYDKLTPEERKAALEKFKFQDDLKDSMKKDWDRVVNYAKLTFDAIDTAKKIGDDISTIATGKNLGELAKAKANEGKKDKEYWLTEQERLKAEKAEQDLIAQKAKWKYANENPDNKYGSKYKEIKKQDEKEAKQKEADDKAAKEKADTEAQEKNLQRMQRLANTVDAITSAPGNIKNAASVAKEKYNAAADKFNAGVNKAVDTAEKVKDAASSAADKVKEVAPKVAGTAAAKSKSAASLTKAKAEDLYKKAGSMAAAAEKAGCSPSTIRNFLGNIKPKKSSTTKSDEPAYKEVKNVQQGRPKDYDSNPSKYTVTTAKRVMREDIDRYNEQLVRNNQEMLDKGMDILNDILRHSDDTLAATFSEDDVASLFHGATFFDYADDSDILVHHGVKGMKWGVRRYQNPDGTLTAAGKERARNKRAGIDTTTKFTGVGDMLLSEITTKAPVWAAMAKATAQTMATNQIVNMDQYIKTSESMRYTDTVNHTSERVNHQAGDFALAKFAAKGAFFAYTMNIPGLQSMALEGGLAGVSAIQKARFAKERAEAPIDKETGLRLKTKELTQFQDCQRVNPGFLSISDGTKNNCMLCTTAYELRRRGYDVQANKATIGYQFGDLKRWFPDIQVKSVKQTSMNLAERQVDRLKLRRDLYERTVAEITKQGNGARGNIMVSWAGGGGHSMAYEVQNGKLKVIDSQGGYIYPHAQLMTMFAYNVQYARLDNLKFDPKGIKEAVN